jgi:hypothetical protein
MKWDETKLKTEVNKISWHTALKLVTRNVTKVLPLTEGFSTKTGMYTAVVYL